jgi:hypothetical protein
MRKPSPEAGGQPFFKNGQFNQPLSRLWLNLTSVNGFSQIAIAYVVGATLGIDYAYDGKRLDVNGKVELYTTVAQTKLAIQARPAFEDTDVVALGFTATVPGKFEFILDHFDGVFTNGQDIYLIDNFTGVVQNIKESAYAFTTEAGTFNKRFEIAYKTSGFLGSDTDVLNSNNIIVAQQGNTINITSGKSEMTEVIIYDIRGRKLYRQTTINDTQVSITDLPVQHEVLIVEVTTLMGKVSKKIIF